MRLAPLALASVLVACGGEADSPIAVEDTDVAVTAEALAPDAATPDPGAAEVDPADAGPDDVFLGSWVGELPVLDDGTHFTAVPPVRAKLEEAFSVEPGLLDRLSNLDEEPYYLVTPIERAGSMLALTFVPNGRFNEDDRPLHLLVADDASHAFALLTTDAGDTFYRASYDASAEHLPAEAAAWMSEQGGVDFAEMVRLDDETELGP